MKKLEGYEAEQEYILKALEKLEQSLDITIGFRKRKAALLKEPWVEKAPLQSYDSLTARERKFIDIANQGIIAVHHELLGLKRSIADIHVPPGSRNVSHKEIVHIRQDLIEIIDILEDIYSEWAKICTGAHRRLDAQLHLSATNDLEAARHKLQKLEKSEIEWEDRILARIEHFHDREGNLQRKVNRLKATGFLRAAIPASFTFGSVLAVHSIQRGAFAPEDNISGIIGVFCMVTAGIMGAIYVTEHRRELEIVRALYG